MTIIKLSGRVVVNEVVSHNYLYNSFAVIVRHVFRNYSARRLIFSSFVYFYSYYYFGWGSGV